MRYRVIVRISAMIILGVAVVGLFSFRGVSAGTPGNIQRISLTSAGAQATGGNSGGEDISGNGRYVAFASEASNLVSGDTNNTSDIFLRDLVNNTTSRISVSSSGVEANGYSSMGAISYDGRYVVFTSTATNLVAANDTNAVIDIFLRDTQNNTTTLVSANSAGVQSNDYNDSPDITADGRFIVFVSRATNLVAGTVARNEIYLKDMITGNVRLVTKNTSGTPMNTGDISYVPSISCDGGIVAFSANATDLVANDTNGQHDVFVQSLVGSDDYRVNVTLAGNGLSTAPVVSCNGNEVIFNSAATNLVSGDVNGSTDTFVYHRHANAIELVSMNSSGSQTSADNVAQAISGNGRYVSFISYTTNVPRSGYVYGSTPNVFVRDLKTGVTQLVSVNYTGGFTAGGTRSLSLTEDGAKVVFVTAATGLIPNDTNNLQDVFTADTGF